jgi:hypothetical protein
MRRIVPVTAIRCDSDMQLQKVNTLQAPAFPGQVHAAAKAWVFFNLSCGWNQ